MVPLLIGAVGVCAAIVLAWWASGAWTLLRRSAPAVPRRGGVRPLEMERRLARAARDSHVRLLLALHQDVAVDPSGRPGRVTVGSWPGALN